MKLCLVVGTINRYAAPPGWTYTHVDAVDRDIWDDALGRPVPPDVVADVRELPFPAEVADRVQLWDVLEHLGEPEAHDALREIRRVLRPGHYLDVQVPDVDVAARWYAAERLDVAGLLQILYGERLPIHDEADYHRFGWTAATLSEALSAEDFRPGSNLAAGSVVARFQARRR